MSNAAVAEDATRAERRGWLERWMPKLLLFGHKNRKQSTQSSDSKKES